MRLLTGLDLPEDEWLNKRAIGRGELRKAQEEEPWNDYGQFDDYPPERELGKETTRRE